MTSPIALRATWNHDPLPALTEPSLAYVLLDVEPPTSGGEVLVRQGDATLNLSLVLDTSGSMSGPKLEHLKEGVHWVVDHLQSSDTLSITLFDEEVRQLVPSTLATDKTVLHSTVDGITEAGGTAMSKGLMAGLQEAVKARRPGVVSRILLLTDGQTWGDAQQCKEYAALSGSAGIPVTALGIGADEDWSIELLDAIASASGGQSGYISKPEEIAGAFREAVLLMQATVARNLRLTFTPSAGVSTRAVYRVAPTISRMALPEPENEGQPYTLSLGDLQSGAGQTLLFEVLVPPRKPGQYRLAQLVLASEANDPANGGGEHSSELDLVVSFAAGGGKGPGDPRVMNNVERATTFKLQTRALQASEAGDVASATRNLRAVATRLLNMGETELAMTAQREADQLEQSGHMSPAGTKKLAFETRKLSVAETEKTKASTVRFDD